ncbi:glycosyltransferase family 4 protein [Micromonospora sp. NPDC000089]|uniref:glycosyltransferase family 4 protein n=1 Tax=unclassified Micromonospora TaxID=2617518 RepID=UPI00369D0694
MTGRTLQLVHRGYFPARAGAELMAQRLAECMRRRGHRVGLYSEAVDEEFRRGAAREGITVQRLPSLTRAADRPDIVHAIDAVWPDYPRAALRLARDWGVPFVFTPASAPEVWQDPATIWDVCRQADAVLVLTSAERQMMRSEGVRGEALHIIGQAAFLPDREVRPQRFRDTHGITGPMVLYVGRKMRSKGYVRLLEAARIVWRVHPDAHFVFLGPCWDDDCQQVFARYADRRIIEQGLVDEADKHDALAACDLFCLPSVVDVFPLVFVEAWSCAKPVISSTFPGSAEVVRHAIDGLVVEPDATSVATAVTRLLSEPETITAWGSNGHSRVRRELNWDAVTERIETVYANLADVSSHQS